MVDWTPHSPHLLEVNFVGMDARQDPADAYVLEDDRLPLMAFGALSLVTPGAEIDVAGTRVRLPRRAGLLLEKLVTDRTGESTANGTTPTACGTGFVMC